MAQSGNLKPRIAQQTALFVQQRWVEDPTLVGIALRRNPVVLVSPCISPRCLDLAQERVEAVGRGVADELFSPVVIHLHRESIDLPQYGSLQAGEQRLP